MGVQKTAGVEVVADLGSKDGDLPGEKQCDRNGKLKKLIAGMIMI